MVLTCLRQSLSLNETEECLSVSTWTTGLSAPSGLLDNDRRRENLRVCFTADGEANASEGVEGEGGGERKEMDLLWI